MASTINSDNGVASGSVGLKYSSDSTGVLALQTNGNTAVTITTANNVGIGTTSPSKLLDVQSTLTSTTAYDNGILRLATNANGSDVTINFTDNTLYNAYMGSGSGSLYFATNGKTERLRIGNDGVVSLSSGQLKFPATQNASSDPNTLDDYEEGTWTPTFTASAGAITSYSSGGRYVKIGQSVSIWFYCIMTNAGSGSGSLNVSGLPFTTSTSTGSNQSQTPILCRETNNTGVIYGGYLDFGATTGYIHTLSTNTMPAYTTGYRYSAVATYQSAS